MKPMIDLDFLGSNWKSLRGQDLHLPSDHHDGPVRSPHSSVWRLTQQAVPYSHSIVSELCKALKTLRIRLRRFAHTVTATVRKLSS